MSSLPLAVIVKELLRTLLYSIISSWTIIYPLLVFDTGKPSNVSNPVALVTLTVELLVDVNFELRVVGVVFEATLLILSLLFLAYMPWLKWFTWR